MKTKHAKRPQAIFCELAATEAVISHLVSHIKATHNLSSIVCIESRRFFFAPSLASPLNSQCVPVRKTGKLPGDVISFKDVDGRKLLLVDDLLGKGGTVLAAKELVGGMGEEVEPLFVFDILAYYGVLKEKLGGLDWYTMVQLE